MNNTTGAAELPEALRFTKKPVTIEAIQWTGKNLRAVITFTDGPPDTRSTHAGMAWEAYADLVARDGLKIYTLEGKMLANVGDWIIRGVKGEYYPCKPDIFEATYSQASKETDLPCQGDKDSRRLLSLEMAHKEWSEKTEWVQRTATTSELGKHRADVLRERIETLRTQVEALRAQPAGAATLAKPSPHADADEIALFDEYMRGCREYNIEPDLGTAFHAGRKSARVAATPAAPAKPEQEEERVRVGSQEFALGSQGEHFTVKDMATASAQAFREGRAAAIAQTADPDVLDAAMRAIQQAVQLIGEPTDERMRTVRRVLRGAVVVAEDETATPAAPAPGVPAKQVIAWRVVHQSCLGHGDVKGDWVDGAPTEWQVNDFRQNAPGARIEYAYTAPQPPIEGVPKC